MALYYKIWCPMCNYKYMVTPFRISEQALKNQACWTCGWQGDKLPPPIVNMEEITEQEFNSAPPGKKFDYVK